MTTLNVEPRRGRWIVRRDGAAAPISEHGDAGAATRAAFRFERCARVLVRDRYDRVHLVRTEDERHLPVA